MTPETWKNPSADLTRNWILLTLVLVVYTLACAPLLFTSNEDMQMVTASFIDSGSLLNDYMGMAGGDINQNHHVHTGVYGWSYNTLAALVVGVERHILRISPKEFFSVIAASVRILSFSLSALAISAFWFLIQQVTRSRLLACLTAMLLAFYHPVFKFSYEIHPEPMGLLAAVLCLFALVKFSETRQEIWLKGAWFCAIACVMAKQSFVFILLLPVGTYLKYRTAEMWQKLADRQYRSLFRQFLPYIKTALLAILLFHPFMILDPVGFAHKQFFITTYHTAREGFGYMQSLQRWAEMYIYREQYVLVAAILSAWHLARYRMRDDGISHIISLCSVYNLLCIFFNILLMRYLVLANYNYPFVVTALLTIVFHFGIFLQKLARPRLATGFAVALFMAMFVPNVIYSLGGAAHDMAFRNTDLVVLRQKLVDLGKRDWRLVYSSSIPAPRALYAASTNDWNFGEFDEAFPGKLKEWKPDVVVIDMVWPFAGGEVVSRAAEAMGLKVADNIISTRPPRRECNFSDPKSLSPCWQAFRDVIVTPVYQRTAGEPRNVFRIYASPEIIRTGVFNH
ncbi:MAG: phospholipid carrier-dependent glycosyltransferase [Pseudomonadota bacterium]|nr:phospholipid carrier-dependent glycosyltransferase [Pseudomonadota bacterium]